MWLTVEDVAERLKVSKRTVLRYIKEEKLKAHRLSAKNIRVDELELEQFVRSL